MSLLSESQHPRKCRHLWDVSYDRIQAIYFVDIYMYMVHTFLCQAALEETAKNFKLGNKNASKKEIQDCMQCLAVCAVQVC